MVSTIGSSPIYYGKESELPKSPIKTKEFKNGTMFRAVDTGAWYIYDAEHKKWYKQK